MMTDMGLAVVVADGNFFVAAAVAAGPLERQRQKTTQVKNYEPREQSLVLLAFDDGYGFAVSIETIQKEQNMFALSLLV
jgi:hypothetical protein